MTQPSVVHAAMQTEVAELQVLARSLAEFAPDLAPALGEWARQLEHTWLAGGPPVVLEQQMERFARTLRQHWLQYAAAGPSAVYRSPTEEQQEGMDENPRLETFGYERDLQPEMLEQRCALFFPCPPPPWRARHLLFSSGQAAMTVALMVLQQRLFPRKIAVAHLGKYFETRSLLVALPAAIDLITPARAMQADCLIVEPIACDGQFTRIDIQQLGERIAGLPVTPRAIIFDSTLLGRLDDINLFLKLTRTEAPPVMMRVSSGLKLFQAGLEIANVGILTWFELENADQPTAGMEAIRQLRTLTGSGLRSADALALEAPWIFDPEGTSRFEQAIFEHNDALAAAVSENNCLFEPLSNAALRGASAPYCVFRLRSPSDEAYLALECNIAAEAHRLKLNFDKGGSFGFRGHRFEVVRPEGGEAPYLRIAMGRRGGWSCDGIIAMMAQLAGHHG